MVCFVFIFCSSVGCFISISFVLWGCNGDNDNDDFVVMVDDFIESFCYFVLYDGNDFESGFFFLVKFFYVL